MSEDAYKELLIEEFKNALEHSRFLEAKRDRFVIGILTVSGAVLILIVQILNKNGFKLQEANVEIILVLSFLFLAIGVLSLFLKSAIKKISYVLKHYEDVLAIVREGIFAEKSVKFKDTDGKLKELMNTRTKDGITPSSISLSNLSHKILCCSVFMWFIAGIGLLIILLAKHAHYI